MGFKVAPEMLGMHRRIGRSWPAMGHRIRREIVAWVGILALSCQVILPFGHNPVAALVGIDCPGLVEAAPDHHHASDDSGAPAGREQPLRHSHHEQQRSCLVCLDLQYAAPLGIVDPPALPAVAWHWVGFVADWMAPAPSGADAFTRPLPRAPPLTA